MTFSPMPGQGGTAAITLLTLVTLKEHNSQVYLLYMAPQFPFGKEFQAAVLALVTLPPLGASLLVLF